MASTCPEVARRPARGLSATRSETDVERMTALALKSPSSLGAADTAAMALPEEVNGYFTEMGRIAVDMGNSVKDVVLSRRSRQGRTAR